MCHAILNVASKDAQRPVHIIRSSRSPPARLYQLCPAFLAAGLEGSSCSRVLRVHGFRVLRFWGSAIGWRNRTLGTLRTLRTLRTLEPLNPLFTPI